MRYKIVIIRRNEGLSGLQQSLVKVIVPKKHMSATVYKM